MSLGFINQGAWDSCQRSLGFLSFHTFSVKNPTKIQSQISSLGWVCFDILEFYLLITNIWFIHSGELIWPEHPLFVDVLPVKHSGFRWISIAMLFTPLQGVYIRCI